MAGLRSAVGARLTGTAMALSLCVPLLACNGGGSSSTSTASSAVSTTTTISTTTTASPSSTTLPPTTFPTSVTTAQRNLDAEVRAAVAAAVDAFNVCLLALPKCDVAALAATRAGVVLERNAARATEWNNAGYAVRDRDRFRYVIESVTVDASGMKATAVVCIADGSKLVRPGAAPDGGDVIVDGAYVSGRERWELRLDAGVWRVYDAPAVGPTEARDVCPAG
jgi:hypothetical protein